MVILILALQKYSTRKLAVAAKLETSLWQLGVQLYAETLSVVEVPVESLALCLTAKEHSQPRQ